MKGQDTYILLFCSFLPSSMAISCGIYCANNAPKRKKLWAAWDINLVILHGTSTTRSSNSDWVLLPPWYSCVFCFCPAWPSLCNFNESSALRLNLKQLWSPKTVQMATVNTICRAAPAPAPAPAVGKWAGIRAWEVLSRQQAFDCPVVAP